jgi:hypothetical protein
MSEYHPARSGRPWSTFLQASFKDSGGPERTRYRSDPPMRAWGFRACMGVPRHFRCPRCPAAGVQTRGRRAPLPFLGVASVASSQGPLGVGTFL